METRFFRPDQSLPNSSPRAEASKAPLLAKLFPQISTQIVYCHGLHTLFPAPSMPHFIAHEHAKRVPGEAVPVRNSALKINIKPGGLPEPGSFRLSGQRTPIA
ncbi:MAG: hypothetical protein PHY24_02195 [Candidatus Cloacimonetes bacterium]|nr:hypothetical protein [Candidatus Cloacimonadota bacterium]